MTTATTVHALALPDAHVLLEVFPRNATTHAFLRVSASPARGTRAPTATFTDAQLARRGLRLGALQAAPEGAAFDRDAAVLRVPHEAGVAQLPIGDGVEPRAFVRTVVTYLRFFEAVVARERAARACVAAKRDELRAAVARVRERVLRGRGVVRNALPVLMMAKHARGGGDG